MTMTASTLHCETSLLLVVVVATVQRSKEGRKERWWGKHLLHLGHKLFLLLTGGLLLSLLVVDSVVLNLVGGLAGGHGVHPVLEHVLLEELLGQVLDVAL